MLWQFQKPYIILISAVNALRYLAVLFVFTGNIKNELNTKLFFFHVQLNQSYIFSVFTISTNFTLLA